MRSPSVKSTQESQKIENHDRELAHEIIDGLRLLHERALAHSEEAASVGLKVSLSSIGAVCDAWLKTLQNALHLSYPETEDRYEELAEDAIRQPSEDEGDGWRPGERAVAED